MSWRPLLGRVIGLTALGIIVALYAGEVIRLVGETIYAFTGWP